MLTAVLAIGAFYSIMIGASAVRVSNDKGETIGGGTHVKASRKAGSKR